MEEREGYCSNHNDEEIAPHTCPFAEDVHQDYESLCNCCDCQMQQCAWDI